MAARGGIVDAVRRPSSSSNAFRPPFFSFPGGRARLLPYPSRLGPLSVPARVTIAPQVYATILPTPQTHPQATANTARHQLAMLAANEDWANRQNRYAEHEPVLRTSTETIDQSPSTLSLVGKSRVGCVQTLLVFPAPPLGGTHHAADFASELAASIAQPSP